jgi:hypothetical protein
MKKAISFLLALVYLVFLTGNYWTLQESGEDEFTFAKPSYSFNLTKTSDDEALPGGDLEFSDAHKHKHTAHLATAGKIKIPRASLLLLTFKKFCSLENIDPHTFAPEQRSVVLYHADLFIKHGVLRI